MPLDAVLVWSRCGLGFVSTQATNPHANRFAEPKTPSPHQERIAQM